MPPSAKQKKIDDLMEKASAALSRAACFEAERMALKALQMARQLGDWDRMARITQPLQEARRLRGQLAFQAAEAGPGVVLLDQTVTENMAIEPGCYLVQPPLVGADARRFRLAALQKEIPVVVVCREPMTQLKLQPIVAIGAGTTVRTKIKPPKKDEPTLEWFAEAMEALGDWAIDMVDREMELTRRIDTLIERLDVVPDHEKLHQVLAETCRERLAEEARAEQDEQSKPRGKSGPRSKVKSS